jgi:mono/diheme cytochrome c family protein
MFPSWPLPHRFQEQMMDTLTRLGSLLAFAAALGASPAVAQAPAGVTPALIAQGDSIFHSKGNCYACHGANAQGTIGPSLTDAEWIHSDGSYEAIVKQINIGVTKEQAKTGIVMPPKGGAAITDEEVNAVAAYVYSLSHKSP